MKQLSYLMIFVFILSCSSYEKYRKITEDLEIPSKIYRADFNQTWQAVSQVMKRFDVAYQNQESGKIKTRWMDNTIEVNFADSFGTNDKVRSAEFKLLVNINEGISYGRKHTKVTIHKVQRVERDFLQGWKVVDPDGIQEQTMLYRIGVIIDNDNKFREIDKAKEEEALQDF